MRIRWTVFRAVMQRATLAMIVIYVLASCVTQQITIVAEPEESKVYVDGEYLGQGVVAFDAGNKYGYPRTHTIVLTHPDLDNLTVDVKSNLDVRQASIGAALNASLGGLNLLIYAVYGSELNLYTGILGLALSPLSFVSSHTFKDSYTFSLD